MANYEVLEPGGHAALVDGLKDYADRAGGTDAEQLADGSVNLDKLDDDVLDVLDTKADIDGYYAQLTAGAADNLTARGDAVEASFIRRTAGGTADIETGQAVVKSIKGRTLWWNQEANAKTASANSSTISTADTTVTCTGTSSSTTYFGARLNPRANAMMAGHKMLLAACVDRSSVSKTCRVSVSTGPVSWSTINGNTSTGSYDTPPAGVEYLKAIIIPASNTSFYINLEVAAADSGTLEGESFTIINPQLFDLTAMFGAGNEPSTVAEFEALFPEPYYEYDAGSLLSVNMEGVETVGFNQWDEEWEVGSINNSDGTNVNVGTNRIRSKGYITVFPNTEYCVYNGSGITTYPCFYDADKGYLGWGNVTFANNKATFTTPANCRYLRFRTNDNYGTTYKGDICINLHWSGYMDGTYEAHWSEQRIIAAIAENFPDGMRGVGDYCDELTNHEAIHRVGEVDLGTLTWTYNTSSANPFFAATLAGAAEPGHVNTNMDATCARYLAGAANYIRNEADYDKRIAYFQGYLNVRDSAYTDPAAFKQAMSGVMLHYALATPTVTPIDPPLNLSYRVDDFGTERIMVPEDERSAPPVLGIVYGLNVVDFVRRAPSEYMSHASMSQFRLALMSHLGIFINETWDEVDNRYEYTITSE